MKRMALVVAAAVAAISLFLLASASVDTELFARGYPILLAINGFIAVALAGLVFVQLRGLWREYRARQFGSRLKYRLMLMFALMAVLPGVLVYAVSLQFVVRSIESWFDVRVDAALEGGIALGQNALDFLTGQIEAKGRELALSLPDGEAVAVPRLNRLREQLGVDSVTVLNGSGQVLATSSVMVQALVPALPHPGQLREARQTQGVHQVEAEEDGSLSIRVILPVPARTLAGEERFLLITQGVPATFARHVESVQEAYREYQQLTLGRLGLKRIYSLTLTLALLLALLAALAVAFLLARRLAAPLLILAEGTQAVAQGDFRPRRAMPARDELGVLIQSFNQMTRQLQDARASADRSRATVESSRAYLESVLNNLSTGVLAFAADSTLRAANLGAMAILQDSLEGFEDLSLAQWPRHPSFREALLKGLACQEADWHDQVELPLPDGSVRTLLIHGARLPEVAGTGQVVVFDDISQLISAQRTAAWAEVARRLAHEIKNPLTPIQLSAERLAFKLADRLDPEGREMLERSTRTIVNQVEAMKNLVNAFRDYAKLPSPILVPLDLNALLREVLFLYESGPVRLRAELATGLPLVLGDASQLRQVIHNLLQNAQEALGDNPAGEIQLLTRREGERVVLLLRDNGPGFPPELLSRAFEPYFTTKARGTGLGLAIVKKIIDEHGGEIRLANPEAGGAEVRIRLGLAPTTTPVTN
ncbi:MAG: ATP-binding protein [Rhodocyclaceae bacterium]|jgi:nitrogen fixation/metabolism regulation signal transduction histidine kinase|nr:ATP-binding protein [Rhodocyclaceae bacterium]